MSARMEIVKRAEIKYEFFFYFSELKVHYAFVIEKSIIPSTAQFNL